MRGLAAVVFAILLSIYMAGPARAQTAPEADPGFEVSWALDGTITAIELGGTLLVSFVRVDTQRRWGSELIGFDLRVRSYFSASAAKVSDSLVAATIVVPLVAHVGQGLDETYGRRALLYGETLGASLLLNAIVKYSVQRPRPYTYAEDPRIQTYATEEGPDSRVSFYSGHSALSFTAAVAGSTLFALSTDDAAAKATMWGLEMTLAAMTANLRVLAGKHFYSDVIVGGAVGVIVGFAIPALHASDRGIYSPSGLELGMAAGGIVVGTTLAQVLPWKRNIVLTLDTTPVARAVLVPVALPSGGGIGLAGAF